MEILPSITADLRGDYPVMTTMDNNFPLKFGDTEQYELSEAAFQHILWGDTVIRPVSTLGGRIQETVLSGGLHTYEGWKKFVALHHNVVHLLQFQAGVHDAWYFARELQNGVITLKIPRRLFTGNAASITRQPDNYYKSGYLWKTLFPTIYKETEILRIIQEALSNIDREDSRPPTDEQPAGVFYGYAAVDDPITAIKIRIQVRGNQILSAFPAWEQPSSGNNGKPYSHAQSIGFQMAESTLDYDKFFSAYGPVFPNNSFKFPVLLEQTPEFIKSRQLKSRGQRGSSARAARLKVLRKYAGKASPLDLDKIDVYLANYTCAKDPFGVQRGIYEHYLAFIDKSLAAFNSAQVMENVAECLWVLAFCDNRFKTRRAVVAIVRFLRMAIVHAGGLNTLMFKRLLGKMVSIALSHHDASALKDVLAALATSPSRAALYTEFDLNPFVKTNDTEGLMIIGRPAIEIDLTTEHLLEFIAFNFGENYLTYFSKAQRLAMARGIINAPNLHRLAEDVMSQFAGSDFDFFMPDKLNLSQLTMRTLPNEDDLLTITRDHGRMMIMLRQRIVLEDPAAYATEPDFSQAGTRAHFELMRQKHKHYLVRIKHEAMLNSVKHFADTVGYGQLSNACQAAIDRLPHERIPLPKSIPDYIDSWRNKASVDDVDLNQQIEQCFGTN
ncbi:hypothetical protein [Eoetvoesiella caeni]|nr:hypothetical protein [Eoetvoesiella caeni]MCI2808178.1 hypothetical protein [Eoetvoesiella caeni]NYT53819.1 hypothetical protein [Eoetvoesiella caeni]